MPDFAQLARSRQLAWALSGGIPADALEERYGKPSWVLKPENQKLNLYRADWWDYIAHAEHRWARALNSSQCFAINIFAPLAEDSSRAHSALGILLPTRELGPEDAVKVQFEFTPDGAPAWLGERKQATQVDVYFEITRSNRCVGHVLVEVKYSERSFGCCRGWKSRTNETSPNPDRSRCLDVSAVISAPDSNCWLVQSEGRRYWEKMSAPGSSIHLEAIRHAGGCPFRAGLYQLMRNRILADELARRTSPAWAEFVVCRHFGNEKLISLEEPVSSIHNAIAAFRALSSDGAMHDWDAEEVVRVIGSTDDGLKQWERWTLGRYFG